MKRRITSLEIELWNTKDPDNCFSVLARRYPFLYIKDDDGIFIMTKMDRKNPVVTAQIVHGNTFDPGNPTELLNIQYSVLVWDADKEFRAISFPSIDHEDCENPVHLSLSWIINHYQQYEYDDMIFMDNDELMAMLNKMDAKKSWIIHNLERDEVTKE